jgi:pyruvate/2-oxoglutarate/acetoin dehydrogenase E1 component
MAKKPYRYAILEAVATEMRKDKDMCYFYEYQSPIATLPTGEVLNLRKEFGEVRTSGVGWPLDEAWYVGCATGMCASGVRTVVELPSMTTVFPFEFIYNQVSNFRMMTGGQANMPMVIWIDGAGRAGGSAQQHSQVGHEALYANVPGLKIVIPSNSYDAAGLMYAAIHDADPVIFCDYAEVASGEQPDMPDGPFEVPIGKAAVRQEGKDLTLVSWAPATVDVNKALPGLQQAGLSVEYIDLRTIKPMDEETLITSAKKTGRLLVVEHGYWTNGFSANVLAVVGQKAPGVKLGRITFPDAGGPNAAEMINWMRPDAPKIIAAAQAIMKV